jgi:ferritin-like metal-binding protein YciE
MSLFSRDIDSFDDLFRYMLEDVYHAENRITTALPAMIRKATNPQLRRTLQLHLAEMENQIARLEQVFQMLDQSPETADFPAIDGLIEESDEISDEIAGKDVLDVALAASAQAVECYEIARYSALIALAERLGYRASSGLLRQTLREKKAAERALTIIQKTAST